MSDFLIQFNATLTDGVVSDVLRHREHMESLPVEHFGYPWGRVAVQHGRGLGYQPLLSNGRVYFALGRPRIVDVTHEDDARQGFTRRWADWVDGAAIAQHYDDLTGLFVLGCCGPEGLLLLTDRLGYYSAFVGRDKNGSMRAIGTLPELVARAAGRISDPDLASVGETLVRCTPGYPHTMWRGVRELAPGALHEFRADRDAPEHTSRSLWVPSEPQRYPSLKQLRAQLTEALQHAAKDITRGAQRVAVALSGGVDSRTVLALVPPEKRAGAITFVDYQNRECELARRVARLARVPHLTLVREPEFYARLPAREVALLGNMRTAMHAHGFAIADAGLADRFDLVLGGLCADTLLKGWFWPDSVRALMAGRCGVPAFLRARLWPPRYSCVDPIRPGGLWALRPEIQLEIQERLGARVAELRKIRPETAAEWTNFYPTCGDVANYPLANMRLFLADELFLHRDIIEVSRVAHHLPKLMQLLTRPVFTQLCGPLARIQTAKTGLPADLGWLNTRLRLRLRRWRERFVKRPAAAPAPNHVLPWYTDDSWPDFRLLQKHSPAWAALRAHAAASEPGLDLLASVLHIDPRSVFSAFNEALSCEFQAAAIQIALWFADTDAGRKLHEETRVPRASVMVSS